MSDPAVCAFLTKVVCSHGGRLDCAQLSSYVAGLSEQQLRQVLEEGAPERFLLARAPGAAGDASSRSVVAVSTVRLCPQKECLGCERLHLCKLNLLGRCRVRDGSLLTTIGIDGLPSVSGSSARLGQRVSFR
ncbi:UNVERIFIED_CONTAM: hypothetical protein K2H54_020451 [Gekko kuhli]